MANRGSKHAEYVTQITVDYKMTDVNLRSNIMYMMKDRMAEKGLANVVRVPMVLMRTDSENVVKAVTYPIIIDVVSKLPYSEKDRIVGESYAEIFRELRDEIRVFKKIKWSRKTRK